MPPTIAIAAVSLVALPGAVFCTSQSSQMAQSYHLDAAYTSPSAFLSGWDFYSGTDPTHGFVKYVDKAAASSANLVSALSPADSAAPFSLAVDSVTVLDPNGPGRKAVRITSRKAWTHGLFVTDIAHMPASACGIWPAFWMVGPNWPNSGEIDIIEGVSMCTNNIMTLHTSPGCTMPPQQSSLQAGSLNNGQCDDSGKGCGVTAASSMTFGAGLNAGGGGIYAAEWTSSHIKIWFFPRAAALPSDLAVGSGSSPLTPTPDKWGAPLAFFEGGRGCEIDSHFMNMSLVFNTAFCGDWAGNQQLWSADPVCGKLAPSCNAYVAANPAAFEDGNWLINSVEVYTLGAAVPANPSTASPPPPSPLPSSYSSSSTPPPRPPPPPPPSTSSPPPSSSSIPTSRAASMSLSSLPSPSSTLSGFSTIWTSRPLAPQSSPSSQTGGPSTPNTPPSAPPNSRSSIRHHSHSHPPRPSSPSRLPTPPLPPQSASPASATRKTIYFTRTIFVTITIASPPPLRTALSTQRSPRIAGAGSSPPSSLAHAPTIHTITTTTTTITTECER